MTIEEKLTHFYDTSVEEARRQAEKEVQEHKESLDAAMEEHKKMALENAASSRKAEIANARREEYLCSKIEEAVCFAEHDEIQIYLSREDEPRLKSLTIKTGFPLRLSGDSFIGGIKAVIPEKNILIDNSFEEGYNTAYRDFKFNGGPAHE